ncbi:helix-turn-helix domain-containing protein [Kitasatospora sp. NPDC089509]|uniref:helix-turn-helix domain-containing protein n=1 Tax=Kitasatospora sp. NPDC089509 TaxID=3364079 RepID=UPI003822B779
MGRRENAVAQVTPELTVLALWLRAQRQHRGLTYRAMAETTNSSSSATIFSRATDGRAVPTWRVVEAYSRACRADLRTARRLWKAARRADQRRRHDRTEEFLNADLAAKFYDVFATKPQLIDSFAKLRLGMVGLRDRDGHPSLAELEKRAGRTPKGRCRLPASSLGKILRSEALPQRRHVIAFVTAVGVPPHTALAWGEAWDRAAGETGRRAVNRTRPSFRARFADPFVPVPMRGFLVDGPNTLPWQETRTATTPVPMRGFLLDDPEPPTGQADETDEAHSAARSDLEADNGLKPEDVAYLKNHGLVVGPSPTKSEPSTALGPVPSLPAAGYTEAGLPIRVPRRWRRSPFLLDIGCLGIVPLWS